MSIFKIKNKYASSKLVQSVWVLASGTALAQIITMLFSPLLTRIYSPTDFGQLITFTSIVAIISTISALTFPIAIVLPEDENEANVIAKLSSSVSIIISLLSLIFIILFEEWLADKLNLSFFQGVLYIFPILIFVFSYKQIFEQWLIRKKKFRMLSNITIIQSLVLNTLKLSIGLFFANGIVLILVATVGYIINSLLLFISSKSYITSKTVINLSMKLETFKKYKDFPIFRGPQVLIAALTQSLPILMLSSLFNAASAGFYSIGMSLLALPAQLLGKAVGDVLFPHVAKKYNNNEPLRGILVKSTLIMFVTGLIPFGIIILFGPYLYSIFFGESWIKAGQYASWMAISSYMAFISVPSIRLLAVINRQKFYLLFTIINILLKAGALALGALYFQSDLVAVALFSIVGSILSIFLVLSTITSTNSETLPSR